MVVPTPGTLGTGPFPVTDRPDQTDQEVAGSTPVTLAIYPQPGDPPPLDPFRDVGTPVSDLTRLPRAARSAFCAEGISLAPANQSPYNLREKHGRDKGVNGWRAQLMELLAFRVQNYKCVIDSNWIPVRPLTVLVGKNESGKTSLLKALYKFNPFKEDPYTASEWPRAHRGTKNEEQAICTTEFRLSDEELKTLETISNHTLRESLKTVTIDRSYSGDFTVHLDDATFPDRIGKLESEGICSALPAIPAEVSAPFRKDCERVLDIIRAQSFMSTDASAVVLAKNLSEELVQVRTKEAGPQQAAENSFIEAFRNQLPAVHTKLLEAPTISSKAVDYVISRMPTFVYMDEYRISSGTALLDQLKQRRDQKQLTGDDKTFLTILSLAGLDLDKECAKATKTESRDERQYDLNDAARALTQRMAPRWGSRGYVVDFRVDGNQFFTFVTDPKDKALIKLEEHSRGFQWFFSFDTMLMHDTKGTLKNCVILLDEPGLHLHPSAQKDLLKTFEEYAKDNTLIYTTHLPFMINLSEPDQIRVLSETPQGTTVTEDLSQSQPEAKLTVQAALGLNGRVGMPLNDMNLVVEGAHDYWCVTALSSLLMRSGKPGLNGDIMITAAGGAPEVTYMATFMVGQELDVVALYDSDLEGKSAKDKFVKSWLARYKSRHAVALSLGEVIGITTKDCAIEDLFPDDFYWSYVKKFYSGRVAASDLDKLVLPAGGELAKRAEKSLSTIGQNFNKGSIAKLICADLRTVDPGKLPAALMGNAEKLISGINEAFVKRQAGKK